MRCTQCIRDFFDNVLYKFTLYLLTYLLTQPAATDHYLVANQLRVILQINQSQILFSSSNKFLSFDQLAFYYSPHSHYWTIIVFI